MIQKLNEKSWMILPEDESVPRQYLIVKSGWSDLYHVIEEGPQEGDRWFDHKFLSEKEVKVKFPEFKP